MGISSLPAGAAGGKEKKPVVVNGDNVEYFQDEQKVVGTGNVIIDYEDMKLTADRMTVYLNTKDAVAEGNVKLYHEGNVYSGEKATYNFDTKKGEVIKGRAEMLPWHGQGETIQKVSAEEYRIKTGFVTSCDLERPHYRIQAKEVKIFLNEKIVANHAFLYVGNCPVLYIPYYVHPLMDDKPRVSISPGYDDEWGGFVLTKWRYYFNESLKGNIHLDYRERKDFAWGVDTKYDTNVVGEGLLQTYYMHERSIKSPRIWDWDDHNTTELERFKVQLRHRWDIDADTYARGEYHKFSDALFNKDYFYRDYEADDTPPTYAMALRQKPFYSAEFRVDKRANHYETVVERLPEFNLDVGRNRFLDTNFYYKSENSIANLAKKYGNDSQEDLDALRFDTRDEISYVKKVFGFLNIAPFVATQQTYYSKDQLGDENRIRGNFSTGIDISTRFYKILPYNTDALGLDIHGLRHVVNPVVRYYYDHTPTIIPNELMQFDSIDTLDRRHGARLELENKLQTKRDVGGTMKTIDLARLLVTTDYLYRVEQGSEFTDINATFELRPYRWLYFEAETQYDHAKAKIERGNWDVVAHDPGSDTKWSFGLGQRYELDHSSQLTAGLSYKIDQKWKVKAYERFQFMDNELKEQEYSIERDLHCWTAELIWNIQKRLGGTIWLVFRLKALPGLPIKASTSYHQPRTSTQNFTP
jgi:LPS-assembly protein